jgi:hypothetical protein
MALDPPPEFSRLVALTVERSGHVAFDIVADVAERRALADRFGLPEIKRLAATGRFSPGRGETWMLAARIEAEVVQNCVITLDPIDQQLHDDLTLVFASDAPDGTEVEFGLDDAEILPPDRMVDIGEIVAQQLSLALDPFPRKPGASLPEYEKSASDKPLAVLAAWHRKDGEPDGRA